MMRQIAVLLAAGLVAGCATAKPILYSNEKYQQAGKSGVDRDIAECQALADQAGATPGAGKGGQRVDRTACAHRWDPPAPDQLLGLREKLDFANAAPPQLDVVASDRYATAAAMRVDLPLDGMDILDRREIEVFAPDKRH